MPCSTTINIMSFFPGSDKRLFKSPVAERAYEKASTSMPFRGIRMRLHAQHLFVARLNNVAVFDCATLNQLRRAEVGCRLVALQMIGWIHGPARCSQCRRTWARKSKSTFTLFNSRWPTTASVLRFTGFFHRVFTKILCMLYVFVLLQIYMS